MRTTVSLLALIALAACASSNNQGGRPSMRGAPGDTIGVLRPAAPNTTAHAELRDADGRSIGTVNLTQMQRGVLLVADLTGLTPGVHAIHVHDSGRCEATFTSAGGHFNPTLRAHGYKAAMGSHLGDMPNILATPTGMAHVEYYSPNLSLAPGGLFDADGASIIVHSGPDDYQSDPAGNSGTRFACGVIQR